MPRDHRRHDANRASSRNNDVLTHLLNDSAYACRRDQYSADRRQINAGSEHVCGGDDDVSRRHVAIDTHTLRIRAKMEASRQAVSAARTQCGPHLRRYRPPPGPSRWRPAQRFRWRIHARRSVFESFSAPSRPIKNVNVGAANRRFMHFDPHIITAITGIGTSSSQRPSSACFSPVLSCQKPPKL